MTFKDGFPDFQRVSYTYSYSLGRESTMYVTKANLGWTSNPSGYTVLTCSALNTGSIYVHFSELKPTENNVFRIFNRSDSTVTGTVTLRIIFVRSDFIH